MKNVLNALIKATIWIVSISFIAFINCAAIFLFDYNKSGTANFDLFYENSILLFFSLGILSNCVINNVLNFKNINNYWVLVLIISLLLVSFLTHTVYAQLYLDKMGDLIQIVRIQNNVLLFTLILVWLDKAYNQLIISN